LDHWLITASFIVQVMSRTVADFQRDSFVSFDPLARSLLAAFSLRLALPLDKFIAFRDISLAAII